MAEPDGWLCTNTTDTALRAMHSLTTSRGYTDVWVTVPRKSSL
jgi:hypothetical protein